MPSPAIPSSAMTLLIAGFGYSARTLWDIYLSPQTDSIANMDQVEDDTQIIDQDLCEFWHNSPHHIIVTTQSEEKYQQLRAQGMEVYLFNEQTPLPATLWQRVTHILHSIPPLRHVSETAEASAMDLLLHHHQSNLQQSVKQGILCWIGYLSTTGVYGDHQGARVTETSQTFATQKRAQKRKICETAYQALATQNCQTQLFRLAGIYGSERNIMRSLQQGTARRIDCGDQKFSRIHVQDLARTLALSLARSLSEETLPNILNLCDDLPEAAEKVCVYGAHLLNITPPPLLTLDQADLSPMARSFYADNRLMDNQALLSFLGTSLCYPTYQDGLQAIHAGKSA